MKWTNDLTSRVTLEVHESHLVNHEPRFEPRRFFWGGAVLGGGGIDGVQIKIFPPLLRAQARASIAAVS